MCNMLHISTIEAKGFEVMFWDGNLMLKPSRYNFEIGTILGVRENGLYRLKGKPIDEGKNKVIET